jgi:hypothetical protein
MLLVLSEASNDYFNKKPPKPIGNQIFIAQKTSEVTKYAGVWNNSYSLQDSITIETVDRNSSYLPSTKRVRATICYI